MLLNDLGSTVLNATTSLAAQTKTKRAKKPAPETQAPADKVVVGKLPRQTTGNSVRPLLGGGPATDEVLSQLSSASSSIQVEMYRLGYDKIVDVLARQARAGVKVQVLLDPTPGYDKLDAENQTRMREFLKSAGVEVINYPIDKSGKIDHVKLLIVDGKSAVIGGLNWDSHSHLNVDMNVTIEGPAVSDLSDVFRNDWKIAGGKSTPKAVPVKPSDAKGDGSIRVATTEEDSEGIRHMLLHDINGAQKSIRMVAFALADKEVIDGLIAAKKRGVDVKVLLDPNKPIAFVNEKSKKLLEAAGVEVRYLKIDLDIEEKLHAKGVIIDEETAILGSANFTNKGLSVNHEAEVEVVSKSVGLAMTKFFDDMWENRTIAKMPNIPDLQERASEEPYGESVAHRLFGWFQDTYSPDEKHNWVGRRKSEILEALEQYGTTGGRAPANASQEEQIGSLAAFLVKKQVWDINPGVGSGAKVYQARMEIAAKAEQTLPQNVAEHKRKMIDMVQTPELRSVLKDILENAPEGFYKAPSSSTGKYHPADETRLADVKPSLEPPTEEEIGKYPGGGLVLHSLRNMVTAAALCEYYGIEGRERDEVIMGEALHDICKYTALSDLENWKPGQPVPWGHWTTKDHAHAGAEFVKRVDPTGGKATEKVRQYIDMHMGAWNFPEATVPRNDAERIISLADYLASTADYYVKV